MGIYYIGMRETDIATNFAGTETDKFFAGSITLYGRNDGDNIAFNALTHLQPQLGEAAVDGRNKNFWGKFIKNQCCRIAAKDKDAKFLPYSHFFTGKIPQELADRIICANDPQLLMFLNSKFKFKDFIKGKLPEAEFIIEKGSTVLKKIQDKTYPNKKEVVIQTEFGEGGTGTMMCTKANMAKPEFKEELLAHIDAGTNYVVSDYIKNICSVAIHILVSDKDIAVYPPSVQLLKGPNYCGSDLAEFAKLPPHVKEKCRDIALKFGKILQNHPLKGRGFFGLDAIVTEDGQVFAVETNPRFTGTTGLLNILSRIQGVDSVFEQTYKCFKGEKLNVKEIENILPAGRKRFASFKMDGSGQAHSAERAGVNQEGFDKAFIQEDNFHYSFSVFDEIKNYNTFDDRSEDRTHFSKIASSRKHKFLPPPPRELTY